MLTYSKIKEHQVKTNSKVLYVNTSICSDGKLDSILVKTIVELTTAKGIYVSKCVFGNWFKEDYTLKDGIYLDDADVEDELYFYLSFKNEEVYLEITPFKVNNNDTGTTKDWEDIKVKPIEFLNILLSVKTVPSAVKVYLNNDYDALIDVDGVKVGCQELSWDVVDSFVDEVNKFKAKLKE